MLFTYKEAIAKYGGRYGLAKAVRTGKVQHVARNLYATDGDDGILGTFPRLYPNAVATGQTALYLHGLIDIPPDRVDLATRRGGTKISSPAVRQSFIPQEWLKLGATSLTHDGVTITAYDLERMLLELMRSRNKLPYDIYREAIGSYRRVADKLDIYKLEEYARCMPRGQSYLERALEEVY